MNDYEVAYIAGEHPDTLDARVLYDEHRAYRALVGGKSTGPRNVLYKDAAQAPSG